MKSKCNAILVISCLLYGAVAGIIINCNGQFYASIAESLNAFIGEITISYAIIGFVSLLSTPFIIKAYRKYNPGHMVSVALACYIGSHMMTGIITQLWQYYLISVIRGIFQGFLVFYLVSALIKAWFLEKSGFALGLTAFSSGIAGIISNLVIGYGIQSIGWRSTLIISCIAAMILSIPGAYKYLYRSPDGNEQIIENFPNCEWKEEQSSIGSRYTFVTGLLMAVLFVLPYCFTQHLKMHAVSEGFSEMTGAGLISISMAGNVFAKFSLSLISDKVKIINSSRAMIICILTGFLFMILPARAWYLYFGSFLLGMSASVIPVIIPQTVAEVYKGKKFDVIYAKYSTILSMASAMWISIIGLLYSIVKSYRPLFILGFLLVGFSFILLHLFMAKAERK